jgi:hypothetical protein
VLERRLQVFKAREEVDFQRVRSVVRRLAEEGFSAAPPAVVALHDKIVVKASTGPSPTVAPSAGAGLHEPAGPVVVAVIDTGIAEDLRSDRYLNEIPRTVGSVDPVDAFGGSPGPNGKLDFAAGHGTFAAGIVRQVDPDAVIRSYAALDSDGLASEFRVACAMIRAASEGAHVINMSLGMHTVDGQPCLALETALDLIDEMAEGSEPPVVVASAGNYGDSEPVWPAASRRVISVAGLTAQGEPARWSSRGVWVDCSTVGEGIVSTFVEGEEDPVFGGSESYPPDAWAIWLGTSFAAPQVAGAISKTCRKTGLSPREAARRLIRSGRPVPDFGRAMHLLPGN